MSAENPQVAEIRAAYDAMCEAMLAADTEKLRDLLGDGYTLTHMTGHVQPLADWLAEIDRRSMIYHHIETVDAPISIDGGTAVLDARTRTDATIWGTRHTWRLRLRTEYRQDEHGSWVATRTVASTW